MKCGKVKNPCKICFQSVSNKNGLQCKGACKKWAHYKCLNFTPGKISDIKAGIIKINCPCPDCTLSEPKEVLTNPPYTCTNQQCPATKLPSCESTDCPRKQKPIPSFEPPILTPPKAESPKQSRECISVPDPRKITSQKCPTPPICPSPRAPTSPLQRKVSPPKRPLSPPRKPVSPRRSASPPRKPCPSCPVHCPKRPQKPNVADKLCSPRKSHSCSFISSKSADSGKSNFGLPRALSSHSVLSTVQQDQKMLFNTIEEMCNTVGQLSNQLKDLMCKMMNAFENENRNRNRN